MPLHSSLPTLELERFLLLANYLRKYVRAVEAHLRPFQRALARQGLGNENEAASAMRMAAGIESNSPLLFSEVIRLRGASCVDRKQKNGGDSISAEGSTFRSASVAKCAVSLCSIDAYLEVLQWTT